MSTEDRPTPLAEEALERLIQYVEGPMNKRVERLLKSRLLLAPVGLGLTVSFRLFVAARDGDARALLPRRLRGEKGGAR